MNITKERVERLRRVVSEEVNPDAEDDLLAILDDYDKLKTEVEELKDDLLEAQGDSASDMARAEKAEAEAAKLREFKRNYVDWLPIIKAAKKVGMMLYADIYKRPGEEG